MVMMRKRGSHLERATRARGAGLEGLSDGTNREEVMEQVHGGAGEWLQFLILKATCSRRNMIDIIRILIIAMEITLPIRQSCLCAAYAN